MAKNINYKYVGWLDDSCRIHGPFPIGRCSIENSSNNNVYFLTAGVDPEKVSAVLSAAQSICKIRHGESNDVSLSGVTNPDDHYVYAYFENGIPQWHRCFYVGKGVNSRWLSHVKDRLSSTGTPAKTPKERDIDSWIMTQPTSKRTLSHAQNNLVRIIGHWSGVHAAACAFAVEYLIIRAIRGVYNLTNMTGGNGSFEDIKVLARDAGLDFAKQCHKAAWDDAVKEFIKDPGQVYISNRIRPLLHLLANSVYLKNLDALAAKVGLRPSTERFGTIPDYAKDCVPIHHAISGAADACITYLPDENSQAFKELKNVISTEQESYVPNAKLLPFRVQIKLRMMEPYVVVNIKPRDNSKGTRQLFKNFIQQKFGSYYPGGIAPIRKPDDPFFKPFAIDGNGKKDQSFPLDKAGGKIEIICNWISGKSPQLLNLEDALKKFMSRC